MIGAPPFFAGAVNATVAPVAPVALAFPIAGASGAVFGGGVGVAEAEGLAEGAGVLVALATGFLTTGFFATALDTGFLTAEKEVVGNRRVNERAKTMNFFMMPFDRFLLSYPMDLKGSTLLLFLS